MPVTQVEKFETGVNTGNGLALFDQSPAPQRLVRVKAQVILNLTIQVEMSDSQGVLGVFMTNQGQCVWPGQFIIVPNLTEQQFTKFLPPGSTTTHRFSWHGQAEASIGAGDPNLPQYSGDGQYQVSFFHVGSHQINCTAQCEHQTLESFGRYIITSVHGS